MRKLNRSETVTLEALRKIGRWTYPKEVVAAAGELASFTKSTIVTALARLVLKGFANRRPDSGRDQFHITESGQERLTLPEKP